MRLQLHPRALALVVLAALAATTTIVLAARTAGAAEATQCHDASLPRQRTEVNADLAVPKFDPALGTLLEVTVPVQSVHLDTDAKFENTAQSAVVFSEDMTYEVTFTSPGGLASPAPVSGSIPRVAAAALTAFDGTLDYLGTSAVTQPSTARDASAAAVSATDAPTLAAFTGAGSVPFHVQSSISEDFIGGGGNVQFEINTFVSASVQVCYRYRAPDVGGTTVTQPPAAPVVAGPRTAG